MSHDVLDQQLRRHTGDRLDLATAVGGYLDEVRRAASVIGVAIRSARSRPDRPGIDLVLGDRPELNVAWTPFAGWSYSETTDERVWYRVGPDGGAAEVVPEAEETAAWLHVLSGGGPRGHSAHPEALGADDEALLERLATYGSGRDPHSPV